MAADPTWLRSSLARYYDEIDVLAVAVSASNRGWTGSPIAADECLAIVQAFDVRGIVRIVRGEWIDRGDPMRADTAQRQAALAALAADTDWVLQIDSDEVLPNIDALSRLLDQADDRGVDAVEWPMRVLYRRLRDGRYLEVTAEDGQAQYEYPGPVAVRPSVQLVDARRTSGRILRPTVVADTTSPQLARPAAAGEERIEALTDADAIVHNSWARTPGEVRSKVASWGHNRGLRTSAYFYSTWLPSRWRWQRMRNLHPLYPGLWPRLGVYEHDVATLLHPADQDAQTKSLV